MRAAPGCGTIASARAIAPPTPHRTSATATFHTRGSGGLGVAACRGEQPRGRPAVAWLSLSAGEEIFSAVDDAAQPANTNVSAAPTPALTPTLQLMSLASPPWPPSRLPLCVGARAQVRCCSDVSRLVESTDDLPAGESACAAPAGQECWFRLGVGCSFTAGRDAWSRQMLGSRGWPLRPWC